MEITKEILEDLYITQNLTRAEVAEKLGIKLSTLKDKLIKFKIKKPSNLHVQNIRKACLEKYGVINGGCAPEVLEKIKKTNLEKFGSEWYLQTQDYKEKTKQTLKKQGVTNVFQLKEVKEKIKQTNLDRYGVEYNMQNKSIRDKVDVTKAKNHTFNTSKPEKEILKLLQSKFSEVKYQYKSKEYPFVCDFYLPSLYLYIEYQGHWSHGKKAFNQNDEQDLNKLEKWKSKDTKYYKHAIDVWTIRDPKKRNYAKENNLNWIEFFTFEDFMNWYQKVDSNV